MKKLTSFILAVITAFVCTYISPVTAENVKTDSNTNILVAYFSCTNTTENIAQYISNITDADIHEILPAVPYTEDDLKYYTDCRADREQSDPSARPEIANTIDNLEQYDAIFLGYPIWHGQAPKIIYTFLEKYRAELGGKTIIPFCTSGSSGIGTSATNLHSLVSSEVTWDSGRRFSGSASEATVKSWIDTITLPEPKPTETSDPTPTINITDTSVSVNNVPKGASVIMAFYMDNALQSVIKREGDTVTEDIPEVYANKMKVFVWDMETLKPLCDSEETSLTPIVPLI